jgi:hypothetical protein
MYPVFLGRIPGRSPPLKITAKIDRADREYFAWEIGHLPDALPPSRSSRTDAAAAMLT